MHAHTRRLSLNSDDSPEKDLWQIFASIMAGPYLAVEIEEVKGVDAHLDFDLGCVHILQGGIKTHHDASIILLPLTKKKICKWTRLIHKSLHSTLGLCYKERFDSLPSLSWALTTLLFPSPLCLFKSTATPSSPAPPHTSFISSASTSHWRLCPSDRSPLHWSCYAAYSGIQRGTPELHLTISISTKRKCPNVQNACTILLNIQRINLKWKYEETKRWKKWCSHPSSLSHGSVPALLNAEHVPNSLRGFTFEHSEEKQDVMVVQCLHCRLTARRSQVQPLALGPCRALFACSPSASLHFLPQSRVHEPKWEF